MKSWRVWYSFTLEYNIFIIVCVFNCMAYAQTTLKLVQIVFRHGDRTPIKQIPNDQHVDFWNGSYGQLTKLGKQQQFEFGSYLRKQYSDLLNETYNEKEIYIQSSDVDRTLMSAYCLLAGLYRPKGDQIWNEEIQWMPIPVHTVPVSSDYVLCEGGKCPIFDNSMRALSQSSNWKAITAKEDHALELIKSKFGENMTADPDEVVDALIIERIYNYTNTNETNEIIKEVLAVQQEHYKMLSVMPDYRRLRGGPLFKKITKNIKDKVHGKLDQKAFLYSTHDTTLMSLSAALGVPLEVVPPPYCSAIITELYYQSNGSQYYVKVWFRNDTSSDKEPHLLTLPGCEALCPFDKFLQLSEQIIPGDIEVECEVNSTIITNINWAASAFIVLIAVLIAGLAVFVIMKQRKNKKLPQYTTLQ